MVGTCAYVEHTFDKICATSIQGAGKKRLICLESRHTPSPLPACETKYVDMFSGLSYLLSPVLCIQTCICLSYIILYIPYPVRAYASLTVLSKQCIRPKRLSHQPKATMKSRLNGNDFIHKKRHTASGVLGCERS